MTSMVAKLVAAGLAAAVIGAGFAGAASADEASIKYRQSVMKSLAGITGATAALTKGQAGTPENAKGLSQALFQLSGVVPTLFPTGSDKGAETAAKPEIWAKPADFKKAVDAFKVAAADFAKVAQGGDMKATTAAFGAVGKSCGGCHETFRVKK